MKYCLEDVSEELGRCSKLHPGFSEAGTNLHMIFRAFLSALPPAWEGMNTLPKCELCSYMRDVEAELIAVLPALQSAVKEFFSVLDTQLRGHSVVGYTTWDKIIAKLDDVFPDRDLALLMLTIGLHVIYSRLSVVRDRASHAKWLQGKCPACSALPHYGFLTREGGVKILECWRCSTRWVFPRIMCLYCLNDDQHQLGYFTLTGECYYRVQFCRKCGKYHKVFDTRSLETEDLLLSVHNLATLSADQVAAKEGFVAGSGLVWAKDASSM